MKTRLSKSLPFLFASGAALWFVAPRIIADEARFFRILSSAPTAITAFTPDGHITWTNAAPGLLCTIQTATNLAGSNWVNYAQVTASNQTTTCRVFDPNQPPDMAFIPGGSFKMGDNFYDPYGSSYDYPVHTNYVSAFFMDRYEVTKALWDDVYDWAISHGYSFEYGAEGKATNHPVQNVTWYDAVKWCNARSEKAGLVPAYYTSITMYWVYRSGTNSLENSWVKWTTGYRLPTEAEWEKAARGGLGGHRFPWATDKIDHGRANYYSSWVNDVPWYPYDESATEGYHPAFESGSKPYTSPAGYFAPNGYGLYDMAGNVWEWCWDRFGSYLGTSETNPRGPYYGAARVTRGGSWFFDAVSCRVAYRHPDEPHAAANSIGFRTVLPSGQ
jgi:formylglycine-generating enzyme